jgi:hypothetical protein
MVRAALNETWVLTLPEVDELSPRMLGIDEHRFRSVRYFRAPASSPWIRHEPWMTTIVDLDTEQVLGVVDGRDHKGVGDWLFAPPAAVAAGCPGRGDRPLSRVPEGLADVASPPVDHFHLGSRANQALTEARQNWSQQIKGRRGRGTDMAWAHRMLLLRADDPLSNKAAHRPAKVFDADDPTGKPQAMWKVEEQLRALLRTNYLAAAATAKEDLKVLVEDAARPATNKLYRTVCR